ncbi:hypothetical protein K1728_05065 [Weissella confusa]|uniref:hypothetical protein n=1 Tax=Weissella confusa TaxID=1583 RepID=UPI001C6F92DA|nr:hypothetical protein [Weissella confusa]QYU58771.1 hypothetical protein K1728_05065 [Weissella confusa]
MANSNDSTLKILSGNEKKEIFDTVTNSINIEYNVTHEKRYTDEVKLSEGYKLREMLFLIWWGKIKKGRSIDTRIPQYFSYEYDIDSKITTAKFFNDNLLVTDTENVVRYSPKGMELAKKYQDLWEIHRIQSFSEITNLDKHWPKWDKEKFQLQDKVNFLNDDQLRFNKFHQELTDYWADDKSTVAEEARMELKNDLHKQEEFVTEITKEIQELQDKIAARDE